MNNSKLIKIFCATALMFVLGVLLRHIVQLDNYSSYILVGIVVILAAIGLYTMLDYFM